MNQANFTWNRALVIHVTISQATMNQFMSNLVCDGFHHVLLKYAHENAEIQKEKFDDVTLQIGGWLQTNFS